MEVLPYIVILALLAALAAALKKMFGRKALPAEGTPPQGGETCATCSSPAGKCLQECALESAVADVEYFDDEELDRFKGRRSDGYTDDEAAQFAEVMYTMKPEEVKDWVVSLGLRGVSLPDQLKDEAMLLME